MSEGPVVIEKIGSLDRAVGRLKAADELRREKELTDQQVELAQERRRRASEEQRAFRRIGPWKNRWPELDQLDQQVLELEMKQSQVASELQELNNRLGGADADHLADLSAWQLGGEKGSRPESKRPQLEAELERKQADHDSLLITIERVQDERVAFVERHRPRLTKDADRKTDETYVEYVAALQTLVEKRQALNQCRRDSIWARIYPHASAAVEWPDQLVGGHAGAHKQIGLERAYRLEEFVGLAMADADWLKQARTREQEAALRGIDPRQLDIGDTHWHDTPEARAERARKMAEWAARR